MDERLKPCPFCGSKKVEPRTDDEGISWYMFCGVCGVSCGYALYKDDAIKAWNERMPSAQLEPLNEEEMRLLKKLRSYHNGSYAKLLDKLVASAQQKPQWILCSERLPDVWDERYLVSLAWGGVGVMEYKSTGFHNYGSFSPVPIESIIAWMPLSEPWRGTI